MTRQQLTLEPTRHPATSFVAARRVQSALSDQPTRAVATAAALVSEIIESLTRDRALDAIELEVQTQPGIIHITLRWTASAHGESWEVDGLARLYLERLTSAWGHDPDTNQIWFQLNGRAANPPENRAA